MSCTFYEYLSPYCDGELDSLQAKGIKEHLESCPNCRRKLDFLFQIRNSLKQGAAHTKAPAHLKKKILHKAHKAQRTIFFSRWYFAYAATPVAIVLSTLILICHHLPVDKDASTDVVDILAKQHAAYGPGGNSLSIESSNSQDAELWFKRKLGLEVSVPNAAFAGYELQGADAIEQNGKKFAYLKYQRNGQTISYIIFKEMEFCLEMPEIVNIDKIEIQIGKKKDTNIAAWKKGGLIYLILTTEDRSELLEYIRRCIRFF
jgi:anti-sigma factor (TIGR02949 family)